MGTNAKAKQPTATKAAAVELSDEELAKSRGGATLAANRTKRGFKVEVNGWSTSGDADDRPTEEIA